MIAAARMIWAVKAAQRMSDWCKDLSVRIMGLDRACSWRQVNGMDILKEILQMGRLGQTQMGCSTLYGDWGIEVAPSTKMILHAPREGACWFHRNGDAFPVRIGAGDLLLATSGMAHALTDAPRRPIRPFDEVIEVMRRRAAAPGAEGMPKVQVLCAKFIMSVPRSLPLLGGLPEVIYLSADQVNSDKRLRAALDLLAAEVAQGGGATDIAMRRLLDTLLIYILRRWFEVTGPGAPAWFRAMDEPGVREALTAIHSAPGEDWTIDKLADVARQSRATFQRRFRAITGSAPMAYVQHCRMAMGARALTEEQTGIAAVAARMGYDSPAAFSKAFRRVMGQSPAEYRSARHAIDRAETDALS